MVGEEVTLYIGIASWQNPDALAQSIRHIQANTTGDFKLLVFDNASPDPRVREVILAATAEDKRIYPDFNGENLGYVGAVNRILQWADWENAHHVAYVDNDAFVRTPGWNERLAEPLNRHHEIAMSFPLRYGSYPIARAGYTEILWGLGCCWILSVARSREIGLWDAALGHQEEADYAIRLRLAGWKLAGVDVDVHHQAKATNDPAAQERINAGVINFVNKWAAYFGGKGVNYHSPNVIRFEDWNINQLYLEEWYQTKQAQGQLPRLNQSVRQATVEGRSLDVVETFRYPHLYRDRLI